MQFWFEFASTYSYPAAIRVEALAKAAGVRLEWKPFLLGPIFKQQGWNDSPFNVYPAKGKYMWRDLERVCDAQGIELRRPTTFLRSGLLAARVACAALDADWLPEFVRRVYVANFVRDLNISQESVVLQCLQGLSSKPEQSLGLASLQATKDRLREHTEQAQRLGIFGAPSFVSGDELFWGNDRLEAALEWEQRLSAPATQG